MGSTQNNFKLYNRYTRKDVCRALGWPESYAHTMYGYREKDGVCAIFVTYNKDANIQNSIRYADKFISRDKFSWMTRSRRTLNCPEVVRLKNCKEMHLFIQKDNRERDFCYLGTVTPDPTSFRQEQMVDDYGNGLPVVNMTLCLHDQVRQDVYDSLVK